MIDYDKEFAKAAVVAVVAFVIFMAIGYCFVF